MNCPDCKGRLIELDPVYTECEGEYYKCPRCKTEYELEDLDEE